MWDFPSYNRKRDKAGCCPAARPACATWPFPTQQPASLEPARRGVRRQDGGGIVCKLIADVMAAQLSGVLWIGNYRSRPYFRGGHRTM